MIFGRHLVTLTPIDFPSTTNWETWVVLQRDVVFFSVGVCRRDIANVIVEVHALDIPRVFGADLLQAVVALSVVFEIDTTELSFEFGANIFKCKVLIN